MKITRMLICFLAVGIVLIGTGCNGQGSSGGGKSDQGSSGGGTLNAEEQWKSQVLKWQNRDYTVLDVVETERWLIEHPSVTIDNGWFVDLGFLAQKRVEDGSIVTRDHNGNLRVAVRNRWGQDAPPEPLDPYDGFITAEESEKWLRNNHFQVQKKADGGGYIITRNITREGFNDKRSWTVPSGSRIVPGVSIPGGIANIDNMGKLRVKSSRPQQ